MTGSLTIFRHGSRRCDRIVRYFLLFKALSLTLTVNLSDYSGATSKLPKILLNGNNICMVRSILHDSCVLFLTKPSSFLVACLRAMHDPLPHLSLEIIQNKSAMLRNPSIRHSAAHRLHQATARATSPSVQAVHWQSLPRSSHSRCLGMLSPRGTIVRSAQQAHASRHIQLAYAQRVYRYHKLDLQSSSHVDPSHLRHVS
jgi:hypothetical protein